MKPRVVQFLRYIAQIYVSQYKINLSELMFHRFTFIHKEKQKTKRVLTDAKIYCKKFIVLQILPSSCIRTYTRGTTSSLKAEVECLHISL